MESPSPVAKQRSPWVYVLIGCLGLAGLICLGTAVVVLGLFKVGKDTIDGVNDPQARQANAIKQLGALPEGYSVVASLNIFGLMQTTLLTDREPLADGGFSMTGNGHVFTYFRMASNENNQKARDFFDGKETDPRTLAQSGINIDAKDIVKRGKLSIDGRKYIWVASRGRLDTGANGSAEGLNNAILFDCGTDALQVGIWSQPDPDPKKAAEELDLAGTVADEEKLSRFLKPMNPCGK